VSLKAPYDGYAREGLLSANRFGGLTLYNYTSRCVFDGNWNYHTETARGLVLDDDGRVIARPFRKFWNLGERPETQANVLPKETPELADKYDGSLMVVFRNPESGRMQAVTRGCWDNPQTVCANAWLATREELFEDGYTYLFELVAPWNRIVVQYEREEMVLIGVMHNESSEDWSYSRVRAWGVARDLESVRFEARPFESLSLDDPAVVNREGYVARFASGLRVKLKYAQYRWLHKLLTGFSVGDIWRLLSEGRALDLSGVPAEFVAWFDARKCALESAMRELEWRAKDAFAAAPKFGSRKEYALHFAAGDPLLRPLLFRMLDGVDYRDILVRHVRPQGQTETFARSDE